MMIGAQWVSRTEAIVEAVAEAYGFARTDLISPRRGNMRLTGARFALYMLLKQRTAMSLPQIWRIIGRDHTTILHGIRRAEGMMADAGYKERFERAKAALQ